MFLNTFILCLQVLKPIVELYNCDKKWNILFYLIKKSFVDVDGHFLCSQNSENSP
jgi:hypothetical protein